MPLFIDFWKLQTENNLLHVFSFLHKLSFENSFCFLSILDCQTSFLVLKIENCFCKQKIRGKNSYQTYPLFWEQFFFLSILACQTSFLVWKIENYFWKQKIRGKTITKHTISVSIGNNKMPIELKCSWLIIL